MGLDIRCDGRALIPRPETELLAERAVRLSMTKPGLTVLDLCTGTGCIAVALAKLGRFSAVAASDISADALDLAEENAAAHGVHVDFINSDLFDRLSGRRFDVIVSNPPYIARAELEDLMPEVRDHDPVTALDGGPDGLSFYRRIAAEAGAHLSPGGCLLLEIGAGQGKAVRSLLEEAGFADVRIEKDYSGRDRVVTAAGGRNV